MMDNSITQSMIKAIKHDDDTYFMQFKETINHYKDDRYQSLLFYAVRQRAFKVTRTLIEYGIDLHSHNKHEDTALHIACYLGDAPITELLLNAGADTNAKNKQEKTPLMLACQKGDKQTVDILLKKGADVNIKDNLHNHVLMFAIKSKKIKLIQTLIDHKAPLHQLNDKKENLMHIAAQHGLPSIIELLNDLGVNAYQPNIYYQTPLHYAVLEPMESVIDLLIELGLNSYDKDHFGESPYDRAESHYYMSAINKFTRQKNAPLTTRLKKKYPLHTALRFKRHDEALSLLSDMSVKQKDNYNNTPLFYAIMHRDLFMVDHILRYNPSLLDIDYTHKDALFYAVLDSNIPLIKKLMQYTTYDALSEETKTLIDSSENLAHLF